MEDQIEKQAETMTMQECMEELGLDGSFDAVVQWMNQEGWEWYNVTGATIVVQRGLGFAIAKFDYCIVDDDCYDRPTIAFYRLAVKVNRFRAKCKLEIGRAHV